MTDSSVSWVTKGSCRGTKISLYEQKHPFDDVSIASNTQGSKQLNQQLGDSLQKLVSLVKLSEITVG